MILLFVSYTSLLSWSLFLLFIHTSRPLVSLLRADKINEIHGAWFDPSNPVVPMNGSLRDDLMDWLLVEEQKADLVLTMGTSLCGMNADRVVRTSSEKLFGTFTFTLRWRWWVGQCNNWFSTNPIGFHMFASYFCKDRRSYVIACKRNESCCGYQTLQIQG